jgi:L-amino acid N-acyltransferase YncA
MERKPRPTVRIAEEVDVQGMLALYAPYVQTTAFSFETEVPSLAQFSARREKCLQRFPWIALEIRGKIAGYAYAGQYREREAYQWTCESSIYLDSQYRGMGIGKELYGALFQLLKMQGMRNAYAVITLPNEASVRLHEKCGFEWFATFEKVGYKLGNWHNVGWWRLNLNEYDQKPPPPLLFPQLDPAQYSGLFAISEQRISEKFT